MIGAFLWFMVKLFLGTAWGFLACVQLKRMKEDNGGLGSFWTAVGAPLLIVFLICDALFNLFWGTIIYRELPKYFPWKDRELLFSARTQRHFRTVAWALSTRGGFPRKTMLRYKAALRWKDRLNAVDPNHIH